MTRIQAFGAIFAIWAVIFLPGLGSTEIKGEEGRRILPAVTMLETGDWVVPHIAGYPYLRKPPLVNWSIATSFKLTGSQNEWTARLPSVLAILALALTTAGVVSGWLGPGTAFLAAFFLITNIGIIEKGRLAEIEAIYTALSGMAIVCWVSWWAVRRSSWLVWTVPFLFLGLAMLAKGPVHLLFFYGVVMAVLWREQKLRALFCWPHLIGFLVMLAIFAAWAVPYFRETAKLNAAGVWAAQMRERVGGGDFDAGSYFVNFPRALSNYLPWLLFVPLWWRRWRAGDVFPNDERLFNGMRDATAGIYLGLQLIPGVLPRYTLPLLAPAALLTAMAVSGAGPAWLRGWQRSIGLWKARRMEAVSLALRTGALIGILMILYALLVVPRLNTRGGARAMAEVVNRAVPPGADLAVFDMNYQPAMFYIRSPHHYVIDDHDLPDPSDYVFVRGDPKKLAEQWREVSVRADLADKGGKKFAVVALSGRRK